MNTKLLIKVRKAVNKHDPISIHFGAGINDDEYDPEIKDIIAASKKCQTIDELTEAIYAIFKEWFGAEVVGKREKYVSLAKELFVLFQNHPERR